MNPTTTMAMSLSTTPSDLATANVGEEQEAFELLKAQLTYAFAAPDSAYRPLTAAQVIERNAEGT